MTIVRLVGYTWRASHPSVFASNTPGDLIDCVCVNDTHDLRELNNKPRPLGWEVEMKPVGTQCSWRPLAI